MRQPSHTHPSSFEAQRRLLQVTGILIFLCLWSLAVRGSAARLLPGPLSVGRALVHLLLSGALVKHLVASLFRVTWGFLLAALLAVPLGLCLGWYRRGERALDPILQLLRPISPLAWIPIAILWFGLGDGAAVFIIFLSCALPLCLSAMSAARAVPAVHIHAGRNFGLRGAALLRRVVFPAALPRLVLGLRLALGIAWLVVVAAEMIAVDSGLGYLIIDARNAGGRQDLVVAGMVLIGAAGLCLDAVMRRLLRLRWAEGAMA